MRKAHRIKGKIPHHPRVRHIARRLQSALLPLPISSAIVRRLLFAALTALPFIAVWLAMLPVAADGGAEYRRVVELRSGADSVQLPLPVAAGETWRLRVEGGPDALRLAVIDPRSGAVAAQTGRAADGLGWTAPETGVWQLEVRSDGLPESWPLTVVAARRTDSGGSQMLPARIALTGREAAIAQGVIDWPGDDDWFAVGMSARNSYTIYTVLGSLRGTRGDVLLPSAAAPSPLGVHANGKTLYGEVSPDEDGVALIRLAGVRGGTGAYALGVTPRGDAPHPAVPAAVSGAREHRLRSATAVARPGELAVELLGEWAAFDAERRAGVWLDTDADGDWDYAAVTRDGWRSQIWSVAERRWLTDGASGPAWVDSNGFDSLILRIPTRGFGAQVRWRAAARHSEDGWRSAPDASGVAEPLPPIPQRASLWPIRESGGTPEQRRTVLTEAGVGAQQAGQPVVVLDPGHGGEQTGPNVNGVVESHSNLALARDVAARLTAAGVHVVLTREGDALASLNFSGAAGRDDLHARVELAHLAGADLFVSLHSNAAHNDWQRGLEAWYYPSPAGDGANRELAQVMVDAVGAALAEWGYGAPSLVYDSSCWEVIDGYCDPLYVVAPYVLLDYQAALDWGVDPAAMGLSDDPWAAPAPLRYPSGWRYTKGVGPIDLVDPERQIGPASVVRGAMMPTVLLELLYMTHQGDAAVLRSESGRAALARGVADGILAWLRSRGELAPR